MRLRRDGTPRSAGPAGAGGPDFLERCRQGVVAQLRERWSDCFPEQRGASPPRVLPARRAEEHGYSVIQEFTIDFPDLDVSKRVIAKTRRGANWGSLDDAADAARAAWLAESEYRELSLAHRFFSTRGGEYQVVRPVAHLDSLNTILVEKAKGRDLGRLVRANDPDLATQFHRCGTWLRHFHDGVHRPRVERWDLERFEAGLGLRARTLATLGVDSALLDRLIATAVAKARPLRSSRVSISTLHGDMKLRHVWATARGIEVLDFGNTHEGECYRDLAAFLVEVLVLTLGKPFANGAVTDELSRAFLDGYLGAGGRLPLLRHYVVESLLKKWGRRLKRWGRHRAWSLVQGGLERMGAKGVLDRLWLDRWFRRAIEVQLAKAEDPL